MAFPCRCRRAGLASGVKSRSFSLLLAKRYLNPRRAMLSSFTLISLVGVMLGVLVLVVVMAVYAGLEREVKGRILGFTPHILLQSVPDEAGGTLMNNWEEAAETGKKIPRVQSATPYISDHVIIDRDTAQRPVMFTAVDTGDAAQMKNLDSMLDREAYPGSSADLGIEDRAVVSSIVADQFKLHVGDIIRLYSTRNFEEVMRVYKATEEPPLREAHKQEWETVAGILKAAWKPDGEGFQMSETDYRAVYEPLLELLNNAPLRKAEAGWLNDLLMAMDTSEKDEEARRFRFTREAKETVENSRQELAEADAEKMDADALKGLRKIVLPKEVTVAGVYQASQMAATPDLFVPLPLAQNLAGLEDGAVQGVALRLDDAYQSETVAAEARKSLGGRFSLTTWGEQYQTFFLLINQQRMMMYFALSFIVLVSAFSMMAVMFTVTILKRREIGVMKAVGAAPGQIVRVFLYQGMLLGLLGGISGIILGRVVIHFRGHVQAAFRTLGFDPFSASFTGFGVLPAHNNAIEQAAIGLLAFLFCSAAALIPAFFAARSDAAKSLRNL